MAIHPHVSIPPHVCGDDDDRRKRPRSEVEDTEIDARPFVIKEPSDPFARPQTFTPLHLLPRAQLPLAYLDTCQRGSRFFSAHIEALENVFKCEGRDAGVLVAREDKDGRIYAIERVKSRTYALCKLADGVTVENIQARSSCSLGSWEPPPKRQASQQSGNGPPWWSRAAVDISCIPAQVCSDSSLLDPESVGELSTSVLVEAGKQEQQSTLGPAGTECDPTAQTVHSNDILQELAKQYAEALYLSRTSLAYFTKGPLSRARAAFSNASGLSLHDLIDFLRDSVLEPSVMDKKYRNGIPEHIRAMPMHEPEMTVLPIKQQKKRKWKAKRDKKGFFANEKEAVERWWWSGDEEISSQHSVETVEAALRRRVPKTRSRETFLQVILVLETLALHSAAGPRPEAVPDASDPGTAAIRELETHVENAQVGVTKKAHKSKNKQDLMPLLETLLDKLCIWHSLEGFSPTKSSSDNDIASQNCSNDELSNFCTEIVVPFYISRIPQAASIVNKKLGGPSAPTPVKHKAAGVRRPGEPAVRQAPEKKQRKPLARVTTDTFDRTSKQPPSLRRAATDSDALPRIKRESSEISLASVPLAPPRKRQSLMHQISFSKREVDLSAMSSVSQVKLRKKAEVEEKLREAISTLKKPNRTLAVKEIADSTDERLAKSKQQMRAKPKSAQSVHITATPKHVRRTQHVSPVATATQCRDSTSHDVVPSSSTRLTMFAQPVPRSAIAIPQTGHRSRYRELAAEDATGETPSRGFARFMPAGLARPPGTLDSPVAVRTSAAVAAAQQTPSKPSKSFAAATAISTPLQPLRATSPNLSRAWRDPQARDAGRHEKSVYAALGWDEEGDG